MSLEKKSKRGRRWIGVKTGDNVSIVKEGSMDENRYNGNKLGKVICGCKYKHAG